MFKKRFALFLTIALALTVAFSPLVSFASDLSDKSDNSSSTIKILSENLVINGDFEEKSSGTMPRGWSFQAYNEDSGSANAEKDSPNISITPEATATGDPAGAIEPTDSLTPVYPTETLLPSDNTVLHLSVPSFNDARAIQEINVEANSCYLISCKIRTGSVIGNNGSTAGANISVMDCFAQSDGILNDSAWKEVSFYGKTDSEQNTIVIALRIGGYSQEAMGEAWFDDVSVVKVECDEALTKNLFMAKTDDTNNNTEQKSKSAMPYFGTILLVTWIMAIAIIFVYQEYTTVKAPTLSKNTASSTKKTIFLLLAAGLVIRIICNFLFKSTGETPLFGHSTDINCFMAWGERMLSKGPSGFYSEEYFADYPPFYMYILMLCSAIRSLLGIASGSAGHALIVKLPSILGDLLFAYILYKLARKNNVSEKRSLIIAGAIAFNPLVIMLSAVWGQIDILLALALLGSVLLFIKATEEMKTGSKLNVKLVLAGLVYGIGIAIKPQALMAGPLMAVAYLIYVFIDSKKKDKEGFSRALVGTITAVLSAVLFILLFALPFSGETKGLGWLIDKYAGTATSYDYATIEAFNLFALMGGNWIGSATKTFVGLTYAQLGTLFMILIGIASAIFYFVGRKHNKGALILSLAFMLTGFFTLGHYMHERYLFPALLLLLVAAILYNDKRLFLSFGWFSLSMFINAAAAFIIVDHRDLAIRAGNYKTLLIIGSIMTLVGFIFLLYTCIKLLISDKTVFMTDDTKKPIKKDTVALKEKSIMFQRTDSRLCFKKIDYILIIAVTVIYGIIAVTNLGTTQAPQTAWNAGISDSEAICSFDSETDVKSIFVFGGIGNSGRIAIYDEKEQCIASYDQEFGHMFRWHELTTTATTTKSLKILVESGKVNLFELAVFDSNDTLIKCSANESGSTLFDEPEQIPNEFSYMNGMYFDELYHGRTAYEHLHNLSSYENSHPPLGKIIISIGIAIFGMNAFGWRIMGALIGVLMVPILYCFAKKIFKKSTFALLTTVLFAFDFMHYTQTRIATIDVYGVFFILLMFYFMYSYFTMNFFVDGLKKTLVPLGIAGIFFGFGAASKWICIYAGGGLAAMLAISLANRYKEYKKAMKYGTNADKEKVKRFIPNLIYTLLFCCIFYLLIPGIIYSLSYLVYPDVISAYKHDGIWGYLKRVWYYQDFMFSYHSGLNATHDFQSKWYEWMLNLRPMWYYKGSVKEGMVATISAFGNPAVWITALFGTIALFIERLRKNIADSPVITLVLIGIVFNLGPWMIVSRCVFVYHYFATVPFIIIGSVYLLSLLEKKYKFLDFAKWYWMGVTVLLFGMFYPFITGTTVTKTYMDMMQWLPRWTFLGSTGPSIGRVVGIIFTVITIGVFVLLCFLRKRTLMKNSIDANYEVMEDGRK